jgi:hypothetical protein
MTALLQIVQDSLHPGLIPLEATLHHFERHLSLLAASLENRKELVVDLGCELGEVMQMSDMSGMS